MEKKMAESVTIHKIVVVIFRLMLEVQELK